MNFNKYTIRGGWSGDEASLELISKRFISTIEQLSLIRAPLVQWYLCDNSNMCWVTLDSQKDNIDNFVMQNKSISEDGHDSGYCLGASDDNIDSSNPNAIRLSIYPGQKDNNVFELQIGTYGLQPDPEAIQYSLFWNWLRVAVSIWPCAWANACIFNTDYDGKSPAPGVPPFPSSRFHMPWISYLSPPLARDLAPPHGVITERAPDGGLFMIATQERLDPSNPVHMTRSRAMSEIMIERVGSS